MHFCIIERKSFEIIASNGQNLNFLFNVPHRYQGSFKICVENPLEILSVEQKSASGRPIKIQSHYLNLTVSHARLYILGWLTQYVY